MSRFDALLCDLDGVLRRWDSSPNMEDLDLANGLPAGTLAAAAFAPARVGPAIIGEHTDEQWRAAVAEHLAATWPTAHALVAEWAALTGSVDAEVAALLTEARRHMPVVLVTNATTRLEADLAALGVDDLVDHVVSSARVGFAKPDHRIYRLAAARAGVAVERCLFVDDSTENVAAARALGMTGLHHRDPAELRDLLQPL